MDAAAATEVSRKKRLLRSPLRRKNFRPRVLLPVAVGVAVLWWARPSLASVCLGLPLVVGGEALRVWAAGYLLKTDELCIVGPYAHLRHPLYAGTLLIASGLAVLAGPHVAILALPLLLGVFVGYYYPYKERVESARLEEHYGERYRTYRASVRGLLPSLQPFRFEDAAPGEDLRWRFDRFRDNDEFGTCFTVALAVAAMMLHFL